MRRKYTFTAFALVMLIVMSDFALLGLAENRMAAAPRIACVGDSITERSLYPEKLQTLLGNGFLVANFGVAGATVTDVSVFPYSDQHEFQRAIDFEPDVVLIMLGTNDANPQIAYSHDSFEEDYGEIVRAFQQLPSEPQIVVVKSPPIFSTTSAYNNTYLVDTVFPSIDNFADEMNLPTIDMYSVLENHSDYFTDGVHPNDEGAAVIASTVYDALSSVEDNDALIPLKR